MELAEFNESLNQDTPPVASVYVKSLWYDRKGKWNMAHDLVNDLADKDSSWVHAYLHRKEGDIWNADYWYSRAGKKRPALSLEEEWEQLLTTFLKKS